MVTINGKLNNATLSGVVRFTPDAVFVDSSTSPKTLISQPIDTAITNGAFTASIPQSQSVGGTTTTEGITYSIQIFANVSNVTFWTLDGVQYTGPNHQYTDNYYYTGSVHDASSRRLDRVAMTTLNQIQDTFHAVVPNVQTAIDFTDLLAISIARPYLDVSGFRIAEILTTNATYLNRISAKFNVRGAYATNTYYTINDFVTYNGNSYIYRNTTSQQNVAPPATGDDANWLMAAAKGAAGGTGAQIIGYNASTWANDSAAAAREDVRAAIASIPNPDLSQYALKSATAPNSNPVFTGKVKRGQMSYPAADVDKDTEIITARYLDNAIAAIAPSILPAPLVFAQRSANLTVSASGTVIVWDALPTNTGSAMDNSGNFIAPATGSYLFLLSTCFYVTADYGSTLTRFAYLVTLNKGTTALGNFLNHDVPASTQTTEQRIAFRFQKTLNAGDSFNITAGVSVFQASGSSQNVNIQSRQLVNGVQSNFLLIWRVSS